MSRWKNGKPVKENGSILTLVALTEAFFRTASSGAYRVAK
jgi:hypothetical protein